ncbi:MAG: 6-phosphogluconolactonase [Gammaproteobacteria bacterium]|nr:6-phosphogluconolactonase [Gammaproteobacteria bacterium]
MTPLARLGEHIHAQVLADGEAVARAAAVRILAAARAAIAARGQFKLVLAGGTTPQAAYRLLANADSADAPWSQWHIYFGDERCLPADNPERNSRMAAAAWLDQVPIPPAQIHPIAAEQGAARAARDYGALLPTVVPFDLVLLGMGEDGHTASLFPGQHYDPAAWVVTVLDAPKPPPQRVSLSPRALSATRALLLLVTGEGKRAALQRWGAGERLPLALLNPPSPIELLLDRAAAGAL